jgi:hypothetical protein
LIEYFISFFQFAPAIVTAIHTFVDQHIVFISAGFIYTYMSYLPTEFDDINDYYTYAVDFESDAAKAKKGGKAAKGGKGGGKGGGGEAAPAGGEAAPEAPATPDAGAATPPAPTGGDPLAPLKNVFGSLGTQSPIVLIGIGAVAAWFILKKKG